MSETDGTSRRARVLRERAARLAAVATSVVERQLAHETVVVACDRQAVAIDVPWLREIVNVPPLAPLPGVPACVRGLGQVRGELICVVDLGLWLGQVAQPSPRLVVVEAPEGPLGLAVPQVVGFRRIYRDELLPHIDSDVGGPAHCFKAMTRDLVGLLDVETVLNHPHVALSRRGEGR